MKADATDLARDTARLLAHTHTGRRVEITRHGKPLATLSAARTMTGKQFVRALERLSADEKRSLRAAIADGMKAVAD